MKLDAPERAELLCFLVIGHLIARASTGEWLKTSHVVEAARMWTASNSSDCDWLERAKLAQMSIEFAPQFLAFPWFMDASKMAELFVDRLRLDYRSPVMRAMLDVCSDHLKQHR